MGTRGLISDQIENPPPPFTGRVNLVDALTAVPPTAETQRIARWKRYAI
jgi:hypothetical protein